MFYKKNQQKINGLWYPKSITWGKAITTNQVADQLALLSTVTRGDAYAIVKNLGKVLSLYMAQGRAYGENRRSGHFLLYGSCQQAGSADIQGGERFSDSRSARPVHSRGGT